MSVQDHYRANLSYLELIVELIVIYLIMQGYNYRQENQW
jgi:hypothetical protein